MRLPCDFFASNLPSFVIRRIHQRWRSYNRRRRVLMVGGLLLAAVVTPVLIVLSLSKFAPSWWPGRSEDQGAVRVRAEAIENAAVAQASLVRAADPVATPEKWFSEEWSVSISEGDANAWLESRLPQWLANRYPGATWAVHLKEVRVRFLEGRVDVAANLSADIEGMDRAGGGAGILGATLRPRVGADGSLWAPASSIFAGRAVFPTGVVVRGLRGRVESALPKAVRTLPEMEGVFRTLLNEQAAAASPMLRIDGGRRVRLLGLRVRDGRAELTCRTEKR